MNSYSYIAAGIPIRRRNEASSWDAQLISEGQRLLNLSATGQALTEYHVEAGIAAIHTSAPRTVQLDWGKIVSLYDLLLTIPSPVVALNRAMAVAQHEGPQRGLEGLCGIADGDRLAAYPFHSAALGELELPIGRHQSAREHFREALSLARNPMEGQFYSSAYPPAIINRMPFSSRTARPLALWPWRLLPRDFSAGRWSPVIRADGSKPQPLRRARPKRPVRWPSTAY